MNSFVSIDKSGCEKYNLFVTKRNIFVTNLTNYESFKIRGFQ